LFENLTIRRLDKDYTHDQILSCVYEVRDDFEVFGRNIIVYNRILRQGWFEKDCICYARDGEYDAEYFVWKLECFASQRITQKQAEVMQETINILGKSDTKLKKLLIARLKPYNHMEALKKYRQHLNKKRRKK
jgi:hypothetical protein